MHFEILVEGSNELTVLSIIMPKIIGEYGSPHTWKIHKHRGVGRLPDDVTQRPNPHDQTLLHQLPSKLRAYSSLGDDYGVVVVLLDLDGRDKDEFIYELRGILDTCNDGLKVEFKFAVEELEAWFLGDREALLLYNPDVRIDILDAYEQDCVCGTWEFLARADEPAILGRNKRSSVVLDKKREWAKRVSPFMDVDANLSESFNDFVACLKGHLA